MQVQGQLPHDMSYCMVCGFAKRADGEEQVMSGGSYSHEYFRVEDEYVGRMFDKELDKMMEDLCKLLHDLEWWQSCDYCEEDYRKTVREFKNKWFGSSKSERLTPIIEESIERLRKELYDIIGEGREPEQTDCPWK